MKYGDPIFGKPGHKFKPRKARVYNRYGLRAIHASRGHGLAQPGPYVKKHYRESILGLFGRKKFVLGIIVLVVILGGIGFYLDPNNPAFHSYDTTRTGGTTSPGDPDLTLWLANAPDNAINEFNSVLASYSTTCTFGVAGACIALTANSTTAAVAISRSPVDLSTIAGKELYVSMYWQYGAACCNAFTWGWFLTTNNTAPLTHGWTPNNDINVAWNTKTSYVSGDTFSSIAYVQKNQIQTIQDEDHGCGSSGSCYLFETKQISNTITTTLGVNSAIILNETGTSAPLGGGSGACDPVQITGIACNWLSMGGNFTSSTILPSFQFQAQTYYVGFYALSNSFNTPIYWFFDNRPATVAHMILFTHIPTPSVVAPPSPTIDTGGWFGPLVRALISIAIFIFQNIVNYAAFMYTIFITGLNLIGGWIGLGTIGTNLDSFLKAFVTFMGQMASIIANLGNGITVLINDISFGATFIVGILATTASWLSAAVLLGGKLKQIFDLVFRYGNNMLWIFFWSTFFLYTATGEGWSGTLEFFNAVNWASSLGANFVIRMVNFGVQAIAFIKGFIPTEAGAPPPTSPVSEGGKPAGASLQSTAKPVPAQPSRFKAGFSRGNITRARGATATKFKLSASRPAAPSFSAALEWDPIKVILLLGGLLLLMLWIGGGLSPFGIASATCTSTTAPTAGNTARCFQTSYDVLSQITAPILLMFASIGSITFLADKFGMIGSTFSGPATFRAVPRRHVRQRRELMKLRAREKQLRMEFSK